MHNKSKLLKDRQNIQDELLKIQSKSISESVITNSDGVITIHMPNAIENIKKSASLKIKLPWIESLLGNHKQGKQNSRLPESSASKSHQDLMTEKMLAERWHCSASRLQRWRAANQGPMYLKIGGKVLYRIEDIRGFEAIHVVRTEKSNP